MSQAEAEVAASQAGEPKGRERWSSRTTFILGAIGSAVGLGNLWRFPYLVFENGGGSFLIPYVICLLFFGVPILLMELTLGRQFQGGDPVCFSSLHPRLVGIGWMSMLGSVLLATYYPIIMAWIVIFFFNSFKNPLPWALNQEEFETVDEALDAGLGFFFGDVLRLSDGPGTQETLNSLVPLSLAFVWVMVFFSIWRGVGLVSQVVKISVPVPIITLIVLLANNIGREGASDGITAYIGNWDLSVLSDASIWQQAVGQVFFSIGICFGVMTAYSSYVESKKGLFADALMIGLLDSAISFFAGFVVFTAVGALAHDLGVDFDNSDFRRRISGFGLVFVSYPAALTALGSNAQVFSAVFFLTLFFLALDSAFSIVEAVVAAVVDTDAGGRLPREGVTLAICIALFIFGIFLTLDNGLYMLDIIDFYLNAYIMQAVGALECMAACWVFGYKESAEELGLKAILIWSGAYLIACFSAPIAIIFAPYYGVWLGFLFYIVISVMGFALALSQSNPVPGRFYTLFLSGGAKKLMNIMAEDEYDTLDRVTVWYNVVLHIWAVMCKYLLPFFLLMITLTGANRYADTPYEGYPQAFQNIGNFIVVLAYGIFFLFLFVRVDAYSQKNQAWKDMREGRQEELADAKDEEIKDEIVAVDEEAAVPAPVTPAAAPEEDAVEVKEASV